MQNLVYLIGRLTKDFEKVEKDGKVFSTNTVAVQRAFKNSEGIYETDFIDFTIFGPMADTCFEYCKKGDLVGLKGRLSKYDNQLNITVEKVSFLQSKSKTDELENTKDMEI